ncbi:MAG: DUF1254 domain-containing protein [Henriciella sp.]|nr:DUF1254 domain-containing protein [Henriciella sp.]
MRWMVSCLVLVISAVVTHYFVLTSIPGFIMTKAHETFEAQGLPVNTWVASPRQTPQTQRIVRPSPDLSYAVCRFNTEDGPVRISAPIWDGYGSLSIFNDQTDNIFVGGLSQGSGFEGVVAAGPDGPSVGPNGEPVVQIEGWGVALIRRLAPSEDRHVQAAGLVSGAVCEPLN